MAGEESDEEEDVEAEEDGPGSGLSMFVADVTEDLDALRAAELTAEAAGIDYGAFEQEVKKTKKAKGKSTPVPVDAEEDMNKMLMSNKKRKLYERMKYGQQKKDAEVGSSALVCGCLIVMINLRLRQRKKLEQRRKEVDGEKRQRRKEDYS
jgi:hypothetical protein